MSPQPSNRCRFPTSQFGGHAERTLTGRSPTTEAVTPHAGAPNVLLILVDDAGFGNPATFGGPVSTPNLDRMANEGLRFNTLPLVNGALLPTRAALLSGRNHPRGRLRLRRRVQRRLARLQRQLAEEARPRSPKFCRGNGYNTACFGKWHLTARQCPRSGGPVRSLAERARLRLLLGLSGRARADSTTRCWPKTTRSSAYQRAKPASSITSPTDMADRTIRWIHEQKAQSPDKPFFIYYSPGASQRSAPCAEVVGR